MFLYLFAEPRRPVGSSGDEQGNSETSRNTDEGAFLATALVEGLFRSLVRRLPPRLLVGDPFNSMNWAMLISHLTLLARSKNLSLPEKLQDEPFLTPSHGASNPGTYLWLNLRKAIQVRPRVLRCTWVRELLVPRYSCSHHHVSSDSKIASTSRSCKSLCDNFGPPDPPTATTPNPTLRRNVRHIA